MIARQGGACRAHMQPELGGHVGEGAAHHGHRDQLGRIGQVPLTLAAQLGSRPAIGSTFNLVTSNIPTGTGFGIQILGFTRLTTSEIASNTAQITTGSVTSCTGCP